LEIKIKILLQLKIQS